MSDDEFERRLRDGLQAAVPDDPDTDAWAGQARRRSAARHRVTVTAVTAVVVVALAGLTLPPLLRGGQEATMSQAETRDAQAPAEAGSQGRSKSTVAAGTSTSDVSCDLGATAPAPSGDLAPGAGSLRLCPAGDASLALVAPPDSLTDPGGIAAVIDAYNTRPLKKSNQVCTAELGPSYRLQIVYPDGSIQAVTGELYGCRTVGDRTGAKDVLEAFAQALQAQRGDRPVAAGTPVEKPSCAGPTGAYVPVDADELMGLRVCIDGQDAQHDLTAAEQKRLVTALGDGATTSFEMPRCSRAEPIVLIGWNAYGEPLRLDYSCGIVTFRQGSTTYGWTPSEADTALIKKLANS